MANLLNRFGQETRIIGNDHASNEDAGFKAEVKGIFESYAGQGVDLTSDLPQIIARANDRREFEDQIMESFASDPMFNDSRISHDVFYGNYAERFGLLLDNSLTSVAIESVTQGYHPIVAYNPFFLKKQWVACIFKDVLMTEVPNSPVINLAFERRYIKTMSGEKYEMPDVFYDDEKMATLSEESQGIPMDATKEISLPLKNVDLLVADYFPNIGAIVDRAEMLNQSLEIAEVHFATADKWIPVHITADATTHAFPPKVISDGEATPETDTLVGNVDFIAGTVTLFSDNDRIKSVWLGGTTANRFNERSLDVVRRVEQIQHVMPESGPRFNTAVTIEEAADALALQKIDMIADNVEYMGRSLAEFEDFEIRTFLWNSFDVQKQVEEDGGNIHGCRDVVEHGLVPGLLRIGDLDGALAEVSAVLLLRPCPRCIVGAGYASSYVSGAAATLHLVGRLYEHPVPSLPRLVAVVELASRITEIEADPVEVDHLPRAG